MKRSFAISVAAVFFAATAHAARQPLIINGVFVDSRTGRGIPGACVELRQRQWGFPLPAEELLATATTDKRGRFQFIGPWQGRLTVWCVSAARKTVGSQEVRDGQHEIRIYGGAFN